MFLENTQCISSGAWHYPFSLHYHVHVLVYTNIHALDIHVYRRQIVFISVLYGPLFVSEYSHRKPPHGSGPYPSL